MAARAAGLIAVAEDLAGRVLAAAAAGADPAPLHRAARLRRRVDLQCGRGGRHLPQGSRHRRGLPVRPGLPADRGDDRRRGGAPRRRSGSRAMTTCPAATSRRRNGPRCAASSACRWSGAGGSSARASCSAGTSARAFGPDDAELLELFAKHAAIALANARMHEAAEERARAEAAAAERDRLLGEVHDTLAQRLVSIRVHLDSARWREAEPGRTPGGGGTLAAGQRGGPGRAGRGPADAARAGRVAAGRADAGRRAARRGGLGARASAGWRSVACPRAPPVPLDERTRRARCSGSPGRR